MTATATSMELRKAQNTNNLVTLTSYSTSVTGGPSEIHFQRRAGDPVIHVARGWLGQAAEKSALAASSG
jgi:hypothetical protein